MKRYAYVRDRRVLRKGLGARPSKRWVGDRRARGYLKRKKLRRAKLPVWLAQGRSLEQVQRLIASGYVHEYQVKNRRARVVAMAGDVAPAGSLGPLGNSVAAMMRRLLGG